MLADDLLVLRSEPGDIAAWPREACRKPARDWIAQADGKNDRDGAGRPLGGADRGRSGHYHDVDVELNELGDQAGEPVRVPFRPAIVDHDSLAFDPTEIAQAPLECRDVSGLVLRVQVPEEADSRDGLCRRLRVDADRRGKNGDNKGRYHLPPDRPTSRNEPPMSV